MRSDYVPDADGIFGDLSFIVRACDSALRVLCLSAEEKGFLFDGEPSGKNRLSGVSLVFPVPVDRALVADLGLKSFPAPFLLRTKFRDADLFFGSTLAGDHLDLSFVLHAVSNRLGGGPARLHMRAVADRAFGSPPRFRIGELDVSLNVRGLFLLPDFDLSHVLLSHYGQFLEILDLIVGRVVECVTPDPMPSL